MARLAAIVAVAAALLLSGPPVGAVPGGIPSLPLEGAAQLSPPQVTAATWILYDDTFARELGSRDPDTRRAMASTTKMMTALVVLDHADLSDRVVISEAAAAVGEAEIDLVAGEVWSVEDLLRALLIRSANDAAVALAEYVGGGSVEDFVAMMNAKADELGLENTHFVNPHGLDAPGHYSSARDLMLIARAGLENEFFAETVRTRTATLPPSPDGEERVARNTNELIGTFEGAIGVKTGFTDDAGLVLVAAAERDGRQLFAVVMGSDDHFADAAALLRYGFNAFGRFNIVASGEELATVRSSSGTEAAVAAEDVELFTSTQELEDLQVVLEYDEGQPVVVLEMNAGEVGRVDLETREQDDLPGLKDALAWASRYWDWIWGND